MPSARLQPIAVEVQPGWSCFNPSIAADDGGYRMIARSSNYSLHNGGYSILDPNGVVRTRNYLLTLDPDFNVLETRPIAEDLGLTTRYPAPAVGFEDCRCISLAGRLRRARAGPP